jgi:hypothetical protein
MLPTLPQTICGHGRWAENCLRCFVERRRVVPQNPPFGPLSAAVTPLVRNPANLRASERGFSGTSQRGGRPALSPEERRQRARERKRRWRAGDSSPAA